MRQYRLHYNCAVLAHNFSHMMFVLLFTSYQYNAVLFYKAVYWWLMLQVPRKRCFVYDPIFSSVEKELVCQLGFQLIAINEVGNMWCLWAIPSCAYAVTLTEIASPAFRLLPYFYFLFSWLEFYGSTGGLDLAAPKEILWELLEQEFWCSFVKTSVSEH